VPGTKAGEAQFSEGSDGFLPKVTVRPGLLLPLGIRSRFHPSRFPRAFVSLWCRGGGRLDKDSQHEVGAATPASTSPSSLAAIIPFAITLLATGLAVLLG